MNQPQNEDVFYKKQFTFLIQHGINGNLLRVLKENFNVTELEDIFIIEKKVAEKTDGILANSTWQSSSAK